MKITFFFVFIFTALFKLCLCSGRLRGSTGSAVNVTSDVVIRGNMGALQIVPEGRVERMPVELTLATRKTTREILRCSDYPLDLQVIQHVTSSHRRVREDVNVAFGTTFIPPFLIWLLRI